MSVIRACLRLVTVAALRDRTWAETRVYNSDNSPLTEALAGTMEAPYIVVYTDDDVRHGVEAKDLLGADRTISLVIAFAVSGPVIAVEGGSAITFPQTDAAFEMVLDLVEAQIIEALVHDPMSAWGGLWGDIVDKFGAEVRSRRGASADTGVRWAARELTLQVDPIADHPPGAPYGDDHPVKRFITMARAATPELQMAVAADMIEAALDPTVAPSWRQAQAWLGLAEEAVRDLGLAPADGGEADIKTESIKIDGGEAIDQAAAAGIIGNAEPDPDAGTKGIIMPPAALDGGV